MIILTDKKCVPCEDPTIKPLDEKQVEEYLAQTPGWIVSGDNKKISKEFKFKNFAEAMAFINKVADIAEGEGHHPDIHVFYNKVTLELWTHAIHGLHENDFILAAKINAL